MEKTEARQLGFVGYSEQYMVWDTFEYGVHVLQKLNRALDGRQLPLVTDPYPHWKNIPVLRFLDGSWNHDN